MKNKTKLFRLVLSLMLLIAVGTGSVYALNVENESDSRMGLAVLRIGPNGESPVFFKILEPQSDVDINLPEDMKSLILSAINLDTEAKSRIPDINLKNNFVFDGTDLSKK